MIEKGPILTGADGAVLLGADGAILRGAPGTASYLLLVPHYLPRGLTPAGTTVTSGIEIPVGWTPTLAVDPLSQQAIQNFWDVGPPGSAEYSMDFYPFVPFQKPVVYWQAIAGTASTYQLTGAGASLGVKTSG